MKMLEIPVRGTDANGLVRQPARRLKLHFLSFRFLNRQRADRWRVWIHPA
jgi:hypothetical protein